MSAARHPQIDSLIECVDETVQIIMCCYSSRFVFWFHISYTHGWFLLQFFNQWHFDTFEVSFILICTSLLVDRLGPVPDAPALFASHLFDKWLECYSRVANTLQAMYGLSFFSTSPYFCSWWFDTPFFKGLYIHLCDQCLGQFRIIDEVGLALYNLLFVAIVIYFLSYPLVRMN